MYHDTSWYEYIKEPFEYHRSFWSFKKESPFKLYSSKIHDAPKIGPVSAMFLGPTKATVAVWKILRLDLIRWRIESSSLEMANW